jgi:predicted PurR-regulated permease PerM
MKKKKQNIFLAKIGLMVFITFVCCILFFFFLLRYDGFASEWHKILNALSPIIIGLALAYLFHPVTRVLEERCLPLLRKRFKKEERAKATARGIAVAGTILFLLAVLILLGSAVIPSLITSISGLTETMPGDVTRFIAKLRSGTLGNFEVTDTISVYLTKLVDYLEEWSTNTILPKAQTYVVQITSGVITMIRSLFNFIIGIIVMAYVLMIQEELMGQSKKIVFAIFKPKQANVIIETVHKADEIFGGFITGKLIDSAIIGVICYIGCLIMDIPDSLLVSVVIGVTNIIPVFGPFIGAVPSLILVVIQSPWHALYLLIFVIILQQIDGNIIGPKILGNSTGLSAFWVMFAILIGGEMFGFLGILLGVPIFAIIYYIVGKLVNYGLKKRGLPTETEEYVEVSGVDAKTGNFSYFIKDKDEENE